MGDRASEGERGVDGCEGGEVNSHGGYGSLSEVCPGVVGLASWRLKVREWICSRRCGM